MVILCLGTTASTDTAYRHAPFAIGQSGEQIRLLNAAGVEVDSTPTGGNYGQQYDDITFGRYLDPLYAEAESPIKWGYLAAPTPEQTNSPGYTGVSATTAARGLSLSVCDIRRDENGNITSDAAVFPGVHSRQDHPTLTLNGISGAPGGATYYYTTNGAIPTAWSAVYDAGNPPVFDRTLILRVIAIGADQIPSKVITQSFIFKESILGGVTGDPSLLPGAAPLSAQVRPADYPEFSLPEPEHGVSFTNGIPIPYGVSPSIINEHRATLMTQLSALPSLSLVIPVRDFFDRDSAGIYACSLNTPSTWIDPHREKNGNALPAWSGCIRAMNLWDKPRPSMKTAHWSCQEIRIYSGYARKSTHCLFNSRGPLEVQNIIQDFVLLKMMSGLSQYLPTTVSHSQNTTV